MENDTILTEEQKKLATDLSVQETTRKKQETEINTKMQEILDLEEVKDIIKDNKIEFEHNGQKYRVSKPSFKDRQIAFKERCEKQSQLLREKNEVGEFKYLSEKDVTNLYQQRGIDIPRITKKIEALNIKENENLYKLGEELKNTQNPKQMDFYKSEIINIREEKSNLINERTALLEFTIENQLLMYLYNKFTQLVTEKKTDGGDWTKVWKTYEEFIEGDEVLINVASMYLTLILNNQQLNP